MSAPASRNDGQVSNVCVQVREATCTVRKTDAVRKTALAARWRGSCSGNGRGVLSHAGMGINIADPMDAANSVNNRN
jgi:hypothetical protein